MITTVLCSSATLGIAVTVYDTPCKVDMGNVGLGLGYTSSVNLNTKVLDFVQLGGPKWIVGGTVFELWLGGL